MFAPALRWHEGPGSAARRVGARLIDLVPELTAAIVIAVLMAPTGRPYAGAFLAGIAALGYEIVTTRAFGATPGKLACGLRVAQLAAPGRPSWAAATRRGLVVAACFVFGGVGYLVALAVAIGLATSAFMSTQRRGVNDRLAGTVVVTRVTPLPVTAEDIDGWVRWVDRPPLTRWGRLATLEERRRARAARIDGAPLLVAWILLSGLVAIFFDSSWVILVLLALAWFVPFIVDETWRVAKRGGSRSHHAHHLLVVDVRTGRPPGTVRSLARAVILSLFLYVPVLIPVLALWIAVSDTSRGPHDRAGGTAVVSTEPAAAGPLVADPNLVPVPY